MKNFEFLKKRNLPEGESSSSEEDCEAKVFAKKPKQSPNLLSRAVFQGFEFWIAITGILIIIGTTVLTYKVIMAW